MFVVFAAVAAGAWMAYHQGWLVAHDDVDDEQERPIVAPLRVVRQDGRVFVVLTGQERAKAGLVTVKALPVQLGHQVTSFGTVVEPSEIIDAISTMRSAKAQVASVEAKTAVSTAAWNRAKALYADGKSMSTAQMQMAEEAYRGDAAAKSEAQAKLAAIEESLVQNWGETVAKAVSGGTPMAAALQNGKQLLLRVPLAQTPAPDHIDVSWDNGGTAAAKLIAQLPKVDARFQQRISLYGLPAAGGPPPGITVGVKVMAGAPQNGIKVPASAVVWWDGSAWIYAQIEDRFSRVRVSDPSVQSDGTVFVAAGPDTPDLENDMIVSQGAQVLLSEESRDRIQVGEEGRSK